jgi:hypothetical protein
MSKGFIFPQRNIVKCIQGFENYKTILINNHPYIILVSRVQMKSWAGKALETVNCCAFLKSKLIGVC